MVKLLLNKWNGGITNDEYIGQQGGQYDIEAVDFRKNSILMRNKKQIALYNSNIVGSPSAFAAYTPPYGVVSSNGNLLQGVIYPILGSVSYAPIYQEKNSEYINNMFVYNGINYVFGSHNIHTWTTSSSDLNLGLLGSQLVVDPSFADAAKWTVNANWSIASGDAVHTAGSTATLETSGTGMGAYTASKKYRVVLSCAYPSTGTVSVTLGGTLFTAITGGTTQSPSSTNQGILTFFGVTANNTGPLIITPSNDFNGTIYNINVYEVLINENYYTYTSTNLTYRPVMQYASKLYFAAGYDLYQIEPGVTPTGALVPILTLGVNDVIKAMAIVGDQMVIRTVNGNNTIQYFWDRVATAPARQITRPDLTIENMANMGEFQYVTCAQGLGTVKSLWKVSGYNKQLLCKSKKGDLRLQFQTDATNAIETYDNTVYLGGTECIYGYGGYYPGFPESVTKERMYTGLETTALYIADGPTMLIGCKSTAYTGAVYIVYDNSDYYGPGAFGFAVTNPIYGPNYSDIKASVKYRVGYYLPPYTGSYAFRPNYIGVYTKIDDIADKFTFYVDGNPVAVVPTVGATYTNSGSTFTITAVFTVQSIANSAKAGYYLVTQRTSGTDDPVLDVGGSILTKATGTGDASVTYLRCRPYEMINVISEASRRRQTYMYNRDFNKIQFGFELVSTATLENVYAEMEDFVLIYNVIQNDI